MGGLKKQGAGVHLIQKFLTICLVGVAGLNPVAKWNLQVMVAVPRRVVAERGQVRLQSPQHTTSLLDLAVRGDPAQPFFCGVV